MRQMLVISLLIMTAKENDLPDYFKLIGCVTVSMDAALVPIDVPAGQDKVEAVYYLYQITTPATPNQIIKAVKSSGYFHLSPSEADAILRLKPSLQERYTLVTFWEGEKTGKYLGPIMWIFKNGKKPQSVRPSRWKKDYTLILQR